MLVGICTAATVGGPGQQVNTKKFGAFRLMKKTPRAVPYLLVLRLLRSSIGFARLRVLD